MRPAVLPFYSLHDTPACLFVLPSPAVSLFPFFYVSITHYRRTYHNFRLGKAEGAKGETNQFHVEPDMPAVDEALLEEETFFSLSGSMTKVR